MKKIIFVFREMIGSLGDLPLFFIFLVGLSQSLQMNPSAILFWSGLAHVIVGCVFKIPLAYQPMKAMGIFAFAYGISMPEFLAAGWLLGIIILILNYLNLFQKFYEWIPSSVIRGIQVGLGIVLFKKAIEFLLLGGDITSLFHLTLNISPSWNFWEFPFASFSWKLFLNATVWLMIWIQLPLTIANSIFSPVLLISDYFPDGKLSPKKIAWSVGFMNLLTIPFGGMPACHGAGGLSAQYRFGARTGVSIIFLGLLKLFFAIFSSSYFLELSRLFPKFLIGLFFIFPAVDLCMRIKYSRHWVDISTIGLTAAVYVLWSAGWSLIAGVFLFYGLSMGFKEKFPKIT